MGAVEGIGRVDRFTGQLWKCWKQLRDEGIQQVRERVLWKTLSDGYLRPGTWVCSDQITYFTTPTAVMKSR